MMPERGKIYPPPVGFCPPWVFGTPSWVFGTFWRKLLESLKLAVEAQRE